MRGGLGPGCGTDDWLQGHVRHLLGAMGMFSKKSRDSRTALWVYEKSLTCILKTGEFYGM